MLPLYGGGFWVAFTQACVVYYAAAAALHFVVPRLWAVSSVQVGKPKEGQVASEAINCLGPLAVKAAMWTAVERMHANNIGLLYDGPLLSSWSSILYALFTIVVLDYAHDAWFYWTHRLLHWAPLYRRVHAMHHRSNVPTAFCGYSFHIVEAAIVFANEVLMCFLLPLHVGLHRAYHIYTTIIHNGGHAGYEIAPYIPSLEGLVALVAGAARRHAPAAPLNTVRHHDMHHRFPNVHFSLYMTHWDRWMGTEHAGYRDAVSKHFAAEAAAVAAVAR